MEIYSTFLSVSPPPLPPLNCSRMKGEGGIISNYARVQPACLHHPFVLFSCQVVLLYERSEFKFPIYIELRYFKYFLSVLPLSQQHYYCNVFYTLCNLPQIYITLTTSPSRLHNREIKLIVPSTSFRSKHS